MAFLNLSLNGIDAIFFMVMTLRSFLHLWEQQQGEKADYDELGGQTAEIDHYQMHGLGNVSRP